MIRKITVDDLELMIQVELEEDPSQDYDKVKEKMMTLINADNFGGLIIDNIGLLLYSIENRSQKYAWPTVYHELDEHFFDSTGDMVVVYQLWIEENQRRKGYATQLKKALESVARELGISTIYTHTDIKNQHVINLNQNLDYKIVRIGAIWDDTLRVSMVKDLRKNTPNTMLQQASTQTCLIDAETLKKRLDSNSIQILDIRYKEDTLENSIDGAIYCHWFDVHKIVDTFKKEQPIAVICYTGQSSMHVATLLNLLDYEAYSLLDGMEKWPYRK